jgi:hypothetical protein
MAAIQAMMAGSIRQRVSPLLTEMEPATRATDAQTILVAAGTAAVATSLVEAQAAAMLAMGA